MMLGLLGVMAVRAAWTRTLSHITQNPYKCAQLPGRIEPARAIDLSMCLGYCAWLLSVLHKHLCISTSLESLAAGTVRLAIIIPNMTSPAQLSSMISGTATSCGRRLFTATLDALRDFHKPFKGLLDIQRFISPDGGLARMCEEKTAALAGGPYSSRYIMPSPLLAGSIFALLTLTLDS